MTLNELLLEWSYRSEKGYPSMDNPSDLSVLKVILKELQLPSDTIIRSLKEQMTNKAKDVFDDEDDREDNVTVFDDPKPQEPEEERQ